MPYYDAASYAYHKFMIYTNSPERDLDFAISLLNKFSTVDYCSQFVRIMQEEEAVQNGLKLIANSN